MDVATAAHIQAFMHEQLQALEDRIDFPLVEVMYDPDEGRLLCSIHYVIRHTLYRGQVTLELDDGTS
jgi:hypothetical protein